jgi:hypothetical protein
MFPSRSVVFVASLLLALSLTDSLHAQRGAISAPQNLAQLTDTAQLIVRGNILSAKFEPHPEIASLKTVVVTMKITETLKGSAPKIYSFRQFIWDIRDRADQAGYRKGQEVLLMMNKPSEVGLTSPVGLEQGRFRIITAHAGNKMAVNGHANAGLFSGMQAELQRRKITLRPEFVRMMQQTGPVGTTEFSQFIRLLVEKR